MSNKYDFFILGQPLFQGYYAMHNMEDATLSIAPLDGSEKLVPRKSKIPVNLMVADKGPSFLDLYGNFLYLIGIVAFATTFFHPELKKKWDINDTSNEKKYVLAYLFYFGFCFLVWKYLFKPAFGLPDINVVFFSLMKIDTEMNPSPSSNENSGTLLGLACLGLGALAWKMR